MYTNKYYKMPIWVSTVASIILMGCGSSSSNNETQPNTPTAVVDQIPTTPEPVSTPDPQPEPQPDPQPEPQPLTITIAGPSDVEEKTDFSLVMDFEGEGKIKSVNWSHDSSLDLAMSNSSDHSVSLTVPDITQDHSVNFTVSVIDDSEQKVEQVHSVSFKRITKSLSVKGVVTDSPVPHAQVSLRVGDSRVEVEANELGEYTAALEVDESEVDEMLKVVALGSSAQPDVEFVSQLGTFETLQAQAGEDGILTNNENFSVNVTNVTTAEYALLQRGLIKITDDKTLRNALQSIDGESLLNLATIIKVIVDSEGYNLPDGIASTLELVSNEEKSNYFENMVRAKDKAHFEKVKNLILEDDNLVAKQQTSLQGEFILHQPKYYNQPAFNLSLNESGKGEFVTENTVAVSKVSLLNDQFVLELAEPAIFYRSSREKVDENGWYVLDEFGNPIIEHIVRKSSKLTLDILHTNQSSSIVELNTHAKEFINDEHNSDADFDTLRVYKLSDKRAAQSVTAEELIDKTWLIEFRDNDFTNSDRAVERLTFNADGTATFDNQALQATWQLEDDSFVINYTSEQIDRQVEFWLIKSSISGFYFVAQERHLEGETVKSTNSLSGIMVAKQANLTVTQEQISGSWIGFIGRGQSLHHLRISENLDVKVGISERTSYFHGKLENNRFYRQRFSDETNGYHTCYELSQYCKLNGYMEYEFLAIEDNHYIVYRKVVHEPNTEDEYISSEGILHYIYASGNEYDEFNSLMFSNSSRFYVESALGQSPQINVRQDRITGSSTISFDDVVYPMAIVEGNIEYSIDDTLMRVSLLNETDSFIEVCVYQVSIGCHESDKQLWYTKYEEMPKATSYFLISESNNSQYYAIEQRWDEYVALDHPIDTVSFMDIEVSGSKIVLTARPLISFVDGYFENISKVEVEERGDKFAITTTVDVYNLGKVVDTLVSEQITTRVDAFHGMQVTEETLYGDWIITLGSSAYTYHFADGVGTKTLFNDETPVEFTWEMHGGNVLSLTFSDTSVERFTLTRDDNVGFQFIRELGSIYPFRPTQFRQTGLMIKSQQIDFKQEDYVGRWLKSQSKELDTFDSAMEIYEDMTVHLGVKTSESQGYFENGQFKQSLHYDHNQDRYVKWCTDFSQCSIYQAYSYTPVARDEDHVYFIRESQFNAYELFLMRKQEIAFEDGFAEFHINFSLLGSNNEVWSGGYDANGRYLYIPNRGQFEYSLKNGKIFITLDDGYDYVIEIVPQSNTVDGITFCMYQDSKTCTEEDKVRLRYFHPYFD
ncbi:hypothetical protein [Pseudoalteromonas luteoviolacea]|uniref:PKD/Chitinase domain-containing protein n=1 Tax=Pseudoalteromonas luteoviolacea S4054 TaxID=1129367 RepID=A0A0F6AIN7_9GAMM|nr:hypothetical protein [Pseudoalteromonas luteoviolacea]AOT07875.1 hypothetical protein S4054249_08490 [Pseudoalteromonas luteoviolacea]AOT12791.1 hypothetical protein S40542_08490 [Pseudoalteromonas luteoviolacea]AOT17704.1 hypothetical protein S4054_08485 [Pseudoalteromonas luteoviolacea]KKE85886.1 hypothetical protein N479_00500 [Pseudoalteromonas luteoviolacea S4054]KZN74764.1 hypothetical protein N481_08880 [Pseudoalteromonas luteoviolacea S4047-1]